MILQAKENKDQGIARIRIKDQVQDDSRQV